VDSRPHVQEVGGPDVVLDRPRDVVGLDGLEPEHRGLVVVLVDEERPWHRQTLGEAVAEVGTVGQDLRSPR
jgi:hypothetical protein